MTDPSSCQCGMCKKIVAPVDYNWDKDLCSKCDFFITPGFKKEWNRIIDKFKL